MEDLSVVTHIEKIEFSLKNYKNLVNVIINHGGSGIILVFLAAQFNRKKI
jgi:hypothetical protein